MKVIVMMARNMFDLKLTVYQENKNGRVIMMSIICCIIIPIVCPSPLLSILHLVLSKE
jgi:hypothetical protein